MLISRRVSLLAVVSLATLIAAAPARAVLLDVTVNTSALSGTSSLLDFVLTNTNEGLNPVTISGFSSDGTLGAVDATRTTPDVTGQLPGNVNLPDNPPPGAFLFERYTQEITLGSLLKFTVAIPGNLVNPPNLPADGLDLALLSPTSLDPLVMTNDPTGADALFAILAQPGSEDDRVDVQIFDSLTGQPDIPVTISIRQPRGDAPEPATVALLGFALLLLPVLRWQRARIGARGASFTKR